MGKNLRIPKELLVMEALLRRLPEDHEQYPVLKEDLAREKLKYEGMQKVYAYLQHVFDKDYQIIPNLRLKGNEEIFSMDFLLLTTRFLVIIDIYHFQGTLILDPDSPHLLQTYNGKTEKVPNPVIYLEKKKDLLIQHFLKNKFTLLPIETLIVNVNPQCDICFDLHPHSSTLQKRLVQKLDTIQEV